MRIMAGGASRSASAAMMRLGVGMLAIFAKVFGVRSG
jgi:hypothetical protein